MHISKSIAVPMLAMTMSGISYASSVEQNFSCPSVAQIKETCDKDGCTYKANAADGKEWVGENPMGSKGEVTTFNFNEAYIRNDVAKRYVACDYEGIGLSGARMSLSYDVSMKAVPTGTSWIDERQPPPNEKLILPRCPEYRPSLGSNPSVCTFELQDN